MKNAKNLVTVHTHTHTHTLYNFNRIFKKLNNVKFFWHVYEER